MGLLSSGFTVKREVNDGIFPNVPPGFSAADSIPATIKCEVDCNGESAVDDIDHLSLKERMRLLLAGGPSGSSSGSELSGRVPTYCVDAAFTEEARPSKCIMVTTRSSGETSESPVFDSPFVQRGQKRTFVGPSNLLAAKHNSRFFVVVEQVVKDFSDRIKRLPQDVLLRIYVEKTASEPPKQGTEAEWDTWYHQFASTRSDGKASPSSELAQGEGSEHGQKKKKKLNKQEMLKQIVDSKYDRMRIGWNSCKLPSGKGIFIKNPYKDQIIRHERSLVRHRPFPSIEPSDARVPKLFFGVDRWTCFPETLLTAALLDNGKEQRVGDPKEMIFITPTCNPHEPYLTHYFETVRQRYGHLSKKMMWETQNFRTRGYLNERVGYEPWAREILVRHKETLECVGLYDAIMATSSYFHRDPLVIRGFLNHWCSITNSFHLPYGEMSITLWDLRMIAGLPIGGAYYDEYIPTDEKLSSFRQGSTRDGYHSEACLELFAELSQFKSIKKIHYQDWLVYFSHGMRLDYSKYNISSKDQKSLRDRFKLKFPRPNKLSSTCELAGFLAYWLSAVALPSSKNADGVRVSCFFVAGALANGRRYSLAPAVLCNIYKAFGNIASNQERAAFGLDMAYCPWHYFCGWLGVYFPWTYDEHPFSYFNNEYIPLYRFLKSRMILQSSEWVAAKIGSWDRVCFYHFPVSQAADDREVMDDNTSIDLSEQEFLISIRTSSLPLREGLEFWREPYYPSRFARQFGYDQGVPTTLPEVTRIERAYGTGPTHWEWMWDQLLLTKTGASFIIPGAQRKTACTYGWMRWWVHQYALVQCNMVVDSPIYISPPKLKRAPDSGLGYLKERRQVAVVPRTGYYKTSLSVPADCTKDDTALEGWYALGTTMHRWAQDTGLTRIQVAEGEEEENQTREIEGGQIVGGRRENIAARDDQIGEDWPVGFAEGAGPWGTQTCDPLADQVEGRSKVKIKLAQRVSTVLPKKCLKLLEKLYLRRCGDPSLPPPSTPALAFSPLANVPRPMCEPEVGVAAGTAVALTFAATTAPSIVLMGTDIPSSSTLRVDPTVVESTTADLETHVSQNFAEPTTDTAAPAIADLSLSEPTIELPTNSAIKATVPVVEAIGPSDLAVATVTPSAKVVKSVVETNALTVEPFEPAVRPSTTPIAVDPTTANIANIAELDIPSLDHLDMFGQGMLKGLLSNIAKALDNPNEWPALGAGVKALEACSGILGVDVSAITRYIIDFSNSITWVAIAEHAETDPAINEKRKAYHSLLSVLEEEEQLVANAWATLESNDVQYHRSLDHLAAISAEIQRLLAREAVVSFDVARLESTVSQDRISITQLETEWEATRARLTNLEAELQGTPDPALVLAEAKAAMATAQAGVTRLVARYLTKL